MKNIFLGCTIFLHDVNSYTICCYFFNFKGSIRIFLCVCVETKEHKKVILSIKYLWTL